MLAGIHPGRVPGSSHVLEFTSGEPLPLFEDGDGFQTPTIVDSPMVLETMAIPSNGSGSLTDTMNPCYLLVLPPPAPKPRPPTFTQNPLIWNLYDILTLGPTALIQDKLPGRYFSFFSIYGC